MMTTAPRITKLIALLAILAFALFGPKTETPADDTLHGNKALGAPRKPDAGFTIASISTPSPLQPIGFATR